MVPPSTPAMDAMSMQIAAMVKAAVHETIATGVAPRVKAAVDMIIAGGIQTATDESVTSGAKAAVDELITAGVKTAVDEAVATKVQPITAPEHICDLREQILANAKVSWPVVGYKGSYCKRPIPDFQVVIERSSEFTWYRALVVYPDSTKMEILTFVFGETRETKVQALDNLLEATTKMMWDVRREVGHFEQGTCCRRVGEAAGYWAWTQE